MKKLSIFQVIILALTVIFTICALVVPSIYVDGQNALVLGFISTFGGSIKISGSNWQVGICWPLFAAFFSAIVGGLLIVFLGKNQKSTYFFAILFFIASGILYGLTKKFFLNVNVAGSIPGMEASVLCAQPWVNIALLSLEFIVSIVAMVYRPNKRYSRY